MNILLLFFGLLSFGFISSEKVPNKVIIVPFGKISGEQIRGAEQMIRKYMHEVDVRKAEDFPKHTYFAPRGRHRADKLIRELNGRAQGKDKFKMLTSFCSKCTAHLRSKGWKI